MAGEICEKCGREIPNHQQAYVVGGKIVCAECDKLLRSEQVPQSAPSPEPFPETRKGTKKDVSLRNRILAAIGIIIVAVVLWNMFFSAPKYRVEEKICNSSLPFYEVTVTSPPVDDFIVMLISSNGERREEETILKKYLSVGPVTVQLSLAALGDDGPVDFSFSKQITKTSSCRLLIKRAGNLKTVYEKEITFLNKNGNISIVPGNSKAKGETQIPIRQ